MVNRQQTRACKLQVPATPVVPQSKQREHHEKKLPLKRLSPLAGLEHIAVLFKSDPKARTMLEEVFDFDGMTAQAYGGTQALSRSFHNGD